MLARLASEQFPPERYQARSVSEPRSTIPAIPRCAEAPCSAPAADCQSVVLIFVTFVPSSDKSPINPFSPKTKPRIGFPRVALSY